MSLWISFLGTLVFSTIFAAASLNGARAPAGRPMPGAVKIGAISQAIVFGAVVGFVLLPNLPPRPPMDSPSTYLFVAGIALIELSRSPLSDRVHALLFGRSSAILRYRRAMLEAHRVRIERRLAALDATPATGHVTTAPVSARFTKEK